MIVLISAMVDPDNYTTEDMCWMDTSSILAIVSMYFPIGTAWLTNVFVLGVTLRCLGTNFDNATTVKAALGFSVLLGISWITAVPAVLHAFSLWEWVFVLSNVFQGVSEFCKTLVSSYRRSGFGISTATAVRR